MGTAKPASSSHLAWRYLLGLLLSLGLAEALLRLGFPYVADRLGAPGFGTYAPTLARLLYAYHEGNFSMLPVQGTTTVYDPHRGYRLAPGLRARMMEAGEVSTNSIGSRGDREYAARAPQGTLRAVALGDSFTFGFGVGDADTWPAQLEALVPDLEVINFGLGAYAHDQMYFALLDHGLPLEPDVVILGFFENDVWRDELLYYAYEKPRFEPSAEGWVVGNVPVMRPEELRDRYRWLPFVYTVPRALWETLLRPPWSVDGGGERATEILRRIRAATEEAGARFVLVNLPDLMSPALATSPDGAEVVFPPPSPPGFFSRLCAVPGAECVDPWPEFWREVGSPDHSELRRRFLRPNDIHYSAAGYAVVAAVLRRHFESHPIVPARRGGAPGARPLETRKDPLG